MNKLVTNHRNVLLVKFNFEDLFTHCVFIYASMITGNDERAVFIISRGLPKLQIQIQVCQSEQNSSEANGTEPNYVRLNFVQRQNC